ncbi:MAG: hypothetical protein L3J96_03575 [Thermoplasmata archaeon]|nr:hypothetical protein [Thermoplasmata archaeon]
MKRRPPFPVDPADVTDLCDPCGCGADERGEERRELRSYWKGLLGQEFLAYKP